MSLHLQAEIAELRVALANALDRLTVVERDHASLLSRLEPLMKRPATKQPQGEILMRKEYAGG